MHQIPRFVAIVQQNRIPTNIETTALFRANNHICYEDNFENLLKETRKTVSAAPIGSFPEKFFINKCFMALKRAVFMTFSMDSHLEGHILN